MVAPGRSARLLQYGPKLSQRQFRQVTKIVNRGKQLKYYYTITNLSATNTRQILDLDSMVAGNDNDQRETSVIQAVSLKGHISVRGADSSNVIRILICRSKKGVLTSADMPLLYGVPDEDLMQVYWDRLILLTTDGPYAINNMAVNIKFKNKKVPGLNIRYDGNAVTPIENGLYIFFISDSIAAADPIVVPLLKLRFYEKD